MSGIRQKSGKSGKSLELAYLSGKSLEFEENCPELSLVNFPEHKTFILWHLKMSKNFARFARNHIFNCAFPKFHINLHLSA